MEPEACSAEDLQGFLDGVFPGWVTDMTATLDGTGITDLYDYRAGSGPFTSDIEPDTLWTDFGYTRGPRYPGLSDGYYFMLRPLTPGAHVLRCTVALNGAPFQEVTYNLNVVPGL